MVHLREMKESEGHFFKKLNKLSLIMTYLITLLMKIIHELLMNININQQEHTSSNNSKYINLIYHNQKYSKYKKDEGILKGTISIITSRSNRSKK